MLSSRQRLIPMPIISRIPTQIHTETPITLGENGQHFWGGNPQAKETEHC